MSKSKYVIGIDYETQSGRAVIVDIKDGREIANLVTVYSKGGIDDYWLSTNEKLSYDWALEDADDYLDVLFTAEEKTMSWRV